MVAACWAIGAALYLQAVWRWRVEHFDPLNNVSEAHHEARLRFAIRTGHATVTSSSLSALPREKGVEVGRTLRFMLGETWEWDATIMAPTGVRHLVLVGSTAPHHDGGNAASSYLIVELGQTNGQYQLRAMSGVAHTCRSTTKTTAAQKGLLRGLRECKRRGWRHVHVAGDCGDVLRRHTASQAPQTQRLAGNYWPTKRLADAIGVDSWTMLPPTGNRENLWSSSSGSSRYPNLKMGN
ncbi:hypothetical protein PF008_g22520 [Phytophthora fragariae]|uniref:RNase H type-1 domain-containing protein n=1 Tax=Phytophthora fragariae TaxID=53985 RepID=A0A6G0QUJ4_9STRA|nr:hypothetical protein PF008_g22520 [Phytophthora fragariae]